MAFRREMDHAADVVFVENPADQFFVGDVALDENIAGVPLHFGQVALVGGIGHFIQIDKRQFGMRRQKIRNEVGTDESGSASD